jgi:iron complex transport system substrate-binding protein
VTVTKQPRRVVSLSPTATETLFAVGAGAQVVAVDDQSDYPKQAPRTALSGFTPNVEAIVGYRPDLVIVTYDTKGLVSSLERLGIPVVLHTPARTLKAAYQQMRQLGLVTGHAPEAGALVARTKKRIAAITGRARSKAAGRSVFHELSPDYYSASSSSFVGAVYALFGLENIADAADGSRSGYPQLSAEYIVAKNPDLIVLADTVCCGQSVAGVKTRPGWDRIDAVRTGSIVRIDDSIASRWGPRVVNFVRAVATALARLEA